MRAAEEVFQLAAVSGVLLGLVGCCLTSEGPPAGAPEVQEVSAVEVRSVSGESAELPSAEGDERSTAAAPTAGEEPAPAAEEEPPGGEAPALGGEGPSGCYSLGWTGGAADNIKIVRSTASVLDGGERLHFDYEWKNGTMELRRSGENKNGVVYKGTWSQDGSDGGASMTFKPGFEVANGYWTSSGSTTQYALSVRRCE